MCKRQFSDKTYRLIRSNLPLTHCKIVIQIFPKPLDLLGTYFIETSFFSLISQDYLSLIQQSIRVIFKSQHSANCHNYLKWSEAILNIEIFF